MPTVLALLILALLLWPLLQKLIRATQQSMESETARPEGTSAGDLVMRESQLSPTREFRPLPAAMTTSDHVPFRKAVEVATPLIPKGGRKSTVVAQVRRTIHPRRGSLAQ